MAIYTSGKPMTHGEPYMIYPKNIPMELKRLKLWAEWRNEDGAKVPYTPNTNKKASTRRRLTWGTFHAALESHGQHADAGGGIGFLLDGSRKLFVIDIDIDESGDVEEQWRVITEIVYDFATYTEFSPSGNGVHIWGYYDGKALDYVGRYNRRYSGVFGFKSLEIYTRGRYMTVTGRRFRGCTTINQTDFWFRHLVNELDLDYPEKKSVMMLVDNIPVPLDIIKEIGYSAGDKNGGWPCELWRGDKGILIRARRNKYFQALYDAGDLSVSNNNHSTGDFRLICLLLEYTGGDIGQTLRLFNLSALANRSKWRDGKWSAYYRVITLRKAYAHCLASGKIKPAKKS